MLPADRWSGTTGLHVAEVELEAPTEDGLHTWSIKAQNLDEGVPHAEASVIFGVRVVSHPEYLVTVETVDRVESNAAQRRSRGDASIQGHHRRSRHRGSAGERKVVQLCVSQTRYLTFGLPVEVTADMTARAELDVEPVTERN